MRRRKTRKRRSGIKLAGALLLVACAIAGAGDRKKSEAHAVVAGTVFHDPGLALPGATVVLALDDAGGNGHFKPQKTLSDDRGEFAFHVPPAAAHYVLRVSAKGFEAQEKKAEVSDPEERVDVNFNLMPKSKQEPQ
jgi:hypothetical protein